MLKHAGLPDAFWAEAAATAVYIKNRLLHSTLDQGTKSPYMVMYKKTPDVGNLRIFGCIAYAHIPKENRKSKLDDRARKCILLGYNAETTTQSSGKIQTCRTQRCVGTRGAACGNCMRDAGRGVP
jgi:hypothetical protein